MQKIIVCSIVCLLAIATAYGQKYMSKQAQNYEVEKPKVNVLVYSFFTENESKLHPGYEAKLSDLVSFLLGHNSMISIFNEKRAENEPSKENANAMYYRSNKEAYGAYSGDFSSRLKNYLESSKINYLVAGKYYEYGEKMSLSLAVYNIDKNSMVRYETGYTDESSLFREINKLTDRITSDVLQASGNSKPAMGFIRFQSKQNPKLAAEYSDFLIKNLQTDFQSNPDSIYTVSSPETWQNYDTLTNDPVILKQLAEDAKLNILVTGILSETGKKLTITPKVYFRKQKIAVEFANIEVDKAGSTNMDYRVFNAVKEIICATNGLKTDSDFKIFSATAGEMRQYLDTVNINGNGCLRSIVMKKLLDKTANDYTLLYKQGLLKMKQGNYPEAISNFKGAIENKSDYDDAYFQLGKIYLLSGNLRLATDNFNKVEKLNPAYNNIYYYLGKTIYLSGSDTIKAKGYLSQALAKKQTNDTAKVYVLLAQIFMRQGNSDSALYYYKLSLPGNSDSIAIVSKISEIYTDKAKQAVKSGNENDAQSFYMKAKDINPSTETYNNIVSYSFKRKRFSEADSLINEGMQAGVYNKDETYFNIGYMLIDSYNDSATYTDAYPAKAIEYFFLHAQLNDTLLTDRTLLSNLGSAYFMLNKFDSAVYYFKRVTESESSNEVDYLNLAESHLLAGHSNDALGVLNTDMLTSLNDNNGYKPIYYFLKSAALTVSHAPANDINLYRTKLDTLLTGEPAVTNWSFKTFLPWIKKNHTITDESKAYYSAKVDMFESMRNVIAIQKY